jgi:hypothetical protein
MPLQGTFDVLGFADVLELLAQKETTGRLHVRSRSIGANVYLEGGRLVGADVGEHFNTSTLDVRSRLEEVCFELLEAERGSFEFVPDTTGMGPPTISLQVDEVLDSARKRLEEWREIQTVIPSLDLHPSVVPDLETDEVTLTRDRWRLLTAIDGRRSIRAVARLLMESDYEVCRSLKSMIEVGVVEIDAPSRSFPGPHREPRVFVDESVEEGEADDVAEAGEAGADLAGAGDAGAETARADTTGADTAGADSAGADSAEGEPAGGDGPGGDGPDPTATPDGRTEATAAPAEPGTDPTDGADPSKGHRQGIIRIGRRPRPGRVDPEG